MPLRVYALVTVQAGLDTLERVRQKMPVDGVIGLNPSSVTDRDAVSGYVNVADYACVHGIPYYLAESYDLNRDSDREMIAELEIDVLAVLGWQRLVPDWLIEHCRVAVLGGHGSADGITHGRGRSPQNWALLLDRDFFEVSLFRIDSGIDSGPVLASREFSYTVWDDIAASYHKVSWLMADMLVEVLQGGKIERIAGQPQSDTDARYMPQRRPEDGEIDWSRSTRDLFNFIRALSRPYPGAWSSVEGGGRLVVWRAIPFEVPVDATDDNFGMVLARHADDSLVVRCRGTGEGCGLLLIQDWEVQGGIDRSTVVQVTQLVSAQFAEQMSRIITRHKQRYPNLTLSESVLMS